MFVVTIVFKAAAAAVPVGKVYSWMVGLVWKVCPRRVEQKVRDFNKKFEER